MITTKFIAADIQNLTDARYFAAWGAAWMSFTIAEDELNEKGLAKYKEIKDWVDGPKFAALFPQNTPAEQMMSFAIKLGLDAIITEESIADQLSGFGQEIAYIITKKDLDDIQDCAYDHILVELSSASLINSIADDIIEEYEIFINTNWSPSIVFSNKHRLNSLGLVLKGGEEEKVGYKSYDELDEIFEVIEELEG